MMLIKNQHEPPSLVIQDVKSQLEHLPLGSQTHPNRTIRYQNCAKLTVISFSSEGYYLLNIENSLTKLFSILRSSFYSMTACDYL